MALPNLTEAQRQEALKKAMEVRQARAELKAQLKSGEKTMADVLDMIEDPIVERLKVQTLLESMPSIGSARAAAIMEDFGIAASRRVKGLGPKQRAQLLELFKK